MGRLLKGLVVLGFALAPLVAPAAKPKTVLPLAQESSPEPLRGRTVQGTVKAIDLSRGTVTIATGSEPLELNALPRQLAALKPGEVVSLAYKNYDGARWLRLKQDLGTGGSGEQEGARDAFGQYGSAAGNVDRVDKRAGRLVVRGLFFRSHPEMIEQLLPGQFVEVEYVEVGGIAWTEKVTTLASGLGAGEQFE